MSEPRRKDENRAREIPAGLTPAEEKGLPPEEYTGYRRTEPEDAAGEGDGEAEREADLQPGAPEREREER